MNYTATLYSYALPTKTQKWPIRKGLILQWNEGWGEIAPLPGFSWETWEDALAEIIALLPCLPSARPQHPSVACGIRAAKEPFIKKPLRVPLCLLNDPKPSFSTIKLKLKHLSVSDAVSFVKRYIGKYRIRCDCNRAWNLQEALFFARHFTRHDFEYLEEPVKTFPDLISFSQITQFPIALDESTPLLDTIPIRLLPSLAAIVLKPTITGVFTLPISQQIPVVLSSSYESSLGLLQIARQAPPSSLPIGLDTFRFFQNDLLIPPLRAEKGYLLWEPTSAFPINRKKLHKICTIKVLN